MHATYEDGTPIFSPCSKFAIRILQGLTLIGGVVHILSYLGTHTIANVIPKVMTHISDMVIKKSNTEDFV